MVSKKVVIKFINGLHMRPAADLVAACRPFDADSSMLANGLKLNLKSVLGVIGAQIQHDDEVELVCSGPQENEAMAALLHVINTER